MKTPTMILLAVLAALSLSAPPALAQDAGRASGRALPHKAMNKLVIQVSDNDPARWGLALNNAENAQKDLGKDNSKIEIVAYGPGVNMLKMDSTAGSRVLDAVKGGIHVVACENTMRKQHLTKNDMLPSIGYIATGVTEIMKRQAQGYAYIRP